MAELMSFVMAVVLGSQFFYAPSTAASLFVPQKMDQLFIPATETKKHFRELSGLHSILTRSLSRQRRDTRPSRKIGSGMMPVMMMPAYYPLVMAEMKPGSVKTRHPSVVAINGCPAYYIADHKGNCMQVFQYTVNFGQPAYRYQPPTFVRPSSFLSNRRAPPKMPMPMPGLVPPPIKHMPQMVRHTPQPSSRNLKNLLRTAAKKFDLSFLKSHSAGSGERTDSAKLDSLRSQILSALKIPSRPKMLNIEMTTPSPVTIPDYDD